MPGCEVALSGSGWEVVRRIQERSTEHTEYTEGEDAWARGGPYRGVVGRWSVGRCEMVRGLVGLM